jgi:hypothetical protein
MMFHYDNLWIFMRRLPFVIIFGLTCAFGGNVKAGESRLLHLSSEICNSKVKGRALTVEIGDSTRSEYYPGFKISGWGGESYLQVDLASHTNARFGKPTSIMVNSRIGVSINQDSSIVHQMYQSVDGNYEWEIILDKKPDTNTFSFPIKMAGLEFLYQPPLTPDETLQGLERPDSVIGSYGVYRSGKRENRITISGKDTVYENYQTGKVFHIYRPKLYDSRGKQVWGELEIDTVLRITIPASFLETAVYPVTIDPTFGNTNVGASTGYLSNSSCNALSGNFAYRHTAAGGEMITSYSIYCLTYSNPAYVSFAAYSYANGYPDSRLAAPVPMTVTNGSMQWNTTSTVSQSMTSGTTYVMAHGDVSPAFSIRARFDTESNVVSVHNAGSLPSTWSHSSSTSNRWSEYVTYTAGTAAQAPRRRQIVLNQLCTVNIEPESINERIRE